MRTALLCFAAALALAAGATPVVAQDYYRDVRPLLVQRCSGCHSDSGIGPFSMEDAEATFRRRRAIAEAILDRQMPPWLAERGHQRYVADLSLDPDDLELVRAWRDGGYPKGDPHPDPAGTWGGAAGAARGYGFHSDLSLEVLPGRSYLPSQETADDYRCFIVPWPQDERTYVTGFRAVPGNLRVSHHVVVHAIDADVVERYRELDEAEEGPGYQCFGGAVPDRLGDDAARAAYEARYPDGVDELESGSFWLAHWAPGMYGQAFPEGTGIPLDPGAALVVQMHYYSRHAPGEADAGSRVEFQVASDVERPAFHLPQTDGAWLDADENGTLVVPPAGRATYEMRTSLADILPLVEQVTGVEEQRVESLTIHSANLHMHKIGHSGEVTLTDSDGRKQTLLAVPRWDLAWQRDFTFVEPKIFAADDLDDTYLAVECTFANPGQQAVYGGYGSDEEMCFNFSYIAVQAAPVATNGAGVGARGPGR